MGKRRIGKRSISTLALTRHGRMAIQMRGGRPRIVGGGAQAPPPATRAGLAGVSRVRWRYFPISRLTWFSCWFSVRFSCLLIWPPFIFAMSRSSWWMERSC